jgi:hypothetical protein
MPSASLTAADYELTTEIIRREAAASLGNYLGHVEIDSRPEPMSWGLCWETWQKQIVRPLIPAIERMAGLRPAYDGPRSFFLVLPRGHDKTGLIGRLANWAIAFARKPLHAVAAASTREQAAILLGSMKAEIRLNDWLAERLTPQSYVVHGPGGKLQIIAADANHSSGLKCDLIICDELTFWAKRDLFDVLYSGREKRPESVFIVITNAGLRGSWQWNLLQQALADSKHWHVYLAPTDTTLAGWMTPDRIAAVRAVIPRGHARRVLDNHWIDQTETPLLSFAAITGCQTDCLWPQGLAPRGTRPELYVGIDIGRTQDRTVIWTIELLGDVGVTREIKVLEAAPFAQQKMEIKQRISRHVMRLRIDKGAVGYQLAEELEAEFPHLVEGVQLTAGRQGQMALAFKTAFESHKIRIPEDPLLQADLQLVDAVETGASGIPILKTHRGPTGHADRFWAGALAWSAIPLNPRPKAGHVPRGRRSAHS